MDEVVISCKLAVGVAVCLAGTCVVVLTVVFDDDTGGIVVCVAGIV